MQQLSIVSREIRDISIRSIPWITFCSTKYKKNHTVVLCRIVSQPFAFGMVKAIYGHLEEYVLLVEMFHIVDFNDHLQSFQVTRRRDNFHQLLFFNELLDHKVFQLHNPVDLSVSTNNSTNDLAVKIYKTSILLLQKVK